MGELVGDGWGDDIADLQRRLTVQEQTSRLINSSVRDGRLVLQDPDGNGIVILGKQDDGTHGITVQNVNGRVLFKVTSEDGQLAPFNFHNAVAGTNSVLSGAPATGFRGGTTSAAYTELLKADIYTVGENVTYDYVFYANGGTLDWRLLAFEVQTGTPTVIVSGSESSNIQRQGVAQIPAACLIAGTGTDPVGRFVTLRMELRRTSGAGTVDVIEASPTRNYP